MSEIVAKIPYSEYGEFKDRCKYLYHIRSEDNRLIPYQPNEAQRYLEKIRQEEFERNKNITGEKQCKIILLKGRQVGGTTDTAMFNMDIMLNLNMAYGLILAHNRDSTPILYEKYRQCYLNLPDKIMLVDDNGDPLMSGDGPLIYWLKPEYEAFSAGQLKFSNLPNGEKSTESRVLVRTAGAGENVGRGDTLNFVHLSEFGYYDYGEEVLTSINQSLPSNSFVYSVIESTANGISGKGAAFYKLWDKSTKDWKRFEQGLVDTFEGYRPVFIPWYKMLKYRKPLVNGKLVDIENVDWDSPENKQQHLEMEEKLVEEIFEDRQQGLEAINWYRWCIKENCHYDILQAKREYPTTPQDAFISSDNSFFDTPKLFVVNENFERNGEPHRDRGYINEYDEFVEDRFGDFYVWEHPQKGYRNRYVCSLDPSEGRDGDYSCIMIFDRLEEKFVAKWYGNLKEDLVAKELLKIAYYYNEALIIPERNLSTVITLIEPDGEYPYTGDIYYQNIASRGFDWGYYTHNNKKDLLMQYNAWLRKDYSKIPDKSILEEHITFVKEVVNGRAKYGASDGNFDDQLIACALAIEGHIWWNKEIYTVEEDDVSGIVNIKKPLSTRRAIRAGRLGKGFRNEKAQAKKSHTKLGMR